MTADTLLLHYSEIALKTGNRLFFERKLRDNAARLFGDCGIGEVRIVRGRIIVPLNETSDRDAIRGRLPFLFGTVHATFAVRTAPDVRAMGECATALVRASGADSFKVETLRSDKRFALRSMEVSAMIGATVVETTGVRVNLTRPAVTCFVEILEKEAYVGVLRIVCSGGLPTGSQQPLLAMLSGGIDSPVAALRMQRRGAEIVAVHYHSYPQTSRASWEKVRDLGETIARAQGTLTVHAIPLLEAQKAIVRFAPPALRVILYRRAMFRIASALARAHGCGAMVTGESLGQVASQTVENIAAIEEAAELPVLRPLIGMNKDEIIAEARRFGTYEVSIRPHDDCCSLFLPTHPETRAKRPAVIEAEGRIEGLPGLEADALARAERWVVG